MEFPKADCGSFVTEYNQATGITARSQHCCGSESRRLVNQLLNFGPRLSPGLRAPPPVPQPPDFDWSCAPHLQRGNQ
ncbi:hypothetical protein SRM_01687 [Salinibacter ruber M8]|uniref:Uncharacterized protein n=1 Tax=Salinibacter ruber (strain M8) TaxID=761659 RepID=D5H9A3_SALRM|nr:hypothetical protein SRM_01687 [Salinibacter ruber M8]